ncbi:MAG: HNH endonuclease [Planctomycetota bacterium]|nr:HNH endonuclease [Planctomycetota bacterium]
MPAPQDPLATLRRDHGNPDAWDPRTRGGAPHKPLVLLAVCDLAEEGKLDSPLIPFDGPVADQLADLFQVYFRALYLDRRGELLLPLWHLKSDRGSIWTLRVREGASPLESRPRSLASLVEHYRGADLSEELHARLMDKDRRDGAREVLLGTYFDPASHDALLQRSRWNVQSESYRNILVDEARSGAVRKRAGIVSASLAMPEPARSQGFRFAVLDAYGRECAACGFRVNTPLGRTIVQGAHIKPWSESKDDRISNGFCLCPTCHSCFDEGLWSVKDLAIRLSPVLELTENAPTYLAALKGRPLRQPTHSCFHPDPSNFEWHETYMFRSGPI